MQFVLYVVQANWAGSGQCYARVHQRPFVLGMCPAGLQWKICTVSNSDTAEKCSGERDVASTLRRVHRGLSFDVLRTVSQITCMCRQAE